MTLFSEKILILDRCISGLMSDLIKKSWTVSIAGAYASREVSNEIAKMVQGKAFCKSQLLNLGNNENVKDCQDFSKTFIPAVLKTAAKMAAIFGHNICNQAFDDLCTI